MFRGILLIIYHPNIAYGSSKTSNTDIINAARKAYVDEFIKTYPSLN
jgi:ABC-type multidrug transport system fused ATPase/permease subunit